jgi:hypothetical protein
MRLRAFPIEALALYTHAAFVLLRDAIIEKGTGSSAGRTDAHTQVDLTSHQGRARLLFYILDTNNTFSFSPVNLSLSLSLSLYPSIFELISIAAAAGVSRPPIPFPSTSAGVVRDAPGIGRPCSSQIRIDAQPYIHSLQAA